MKNLVLIDFTPESIEALDYAIDFTKAIKGKLEIVNVSDDVDYHKQIQKLNDLKARYTTSEIQIDTVELTGDLETAIADYVNGDNIGFVFSGTHELKVMEHFFSSRTLHILNEVKANFVFIPHNLKTFRPITKVLMPVFEDKKSLQNIEALRFINHYMKLHVVLGSYNTSDSEVKQNLIVASKLLVGAAIPFTIQTLGNSENSLKKQLIDLAKIEKTDMISIVNLTEEKFFNMSEKGFVDELIRNDVGLPVLVIQNQNTASYSSFHTTGGY
jgi:nucleotide-binding universal stress UspA family protein